MSKTITALPAEEIEIKFKDKSLIAIFNMKAVGYMQQELLKTKRNKNSILDFGIVVLYGGLRASDPNFKLEEARALALTMNPASLNEIIEAYMESACTGGENESMEEAKKKILAQMLVNFAK